MTDSDTEDMTKIASKIHQAETLMAVSDGSVKESRMSCGWVLSDGKQETATGHGHCNGKPSSMRAEAEGMLAITIFLGATQEFINFTCGPIKVNFHADDKALITRRQDHDNCDIPFSNQWSLPEADLIESTYTRQQQY